MVKEFGHNTTVLIVDDEPIIRMDIKEILTSQNYQVVGEASDGFDAIELCKIKKPDLVLMDIKMPLLDGISAAKIIFEEGYANTIVLLTAYSEYEFINKAKNIGISGYLVKPIDEKSLIPSIEIAIARSAELLQMKMQSEKLSSQLEIRKLVERAKGIIMQRQNMTENDAYEYMRKLSLTKKLSIKKIAEITLMQNEVSV